MFSRLKPIGELRGHTVWMAVPIVMGLGYPTETVSRIISGKHWPGAAGDYYWVLEGEEMETFHRHYLTPSRRRLVLLFWDGVLDLIMCQSGDLGRRFRRLLANSRPLLREGALEELEALIYQPALPQNVVALKKPVKGVAP